MPIRRLLLTGVNEMLFDSDKFTFALADDFKTEGWTAQGTNVVRLWFPGNLFLTLLNRPSSSHEKSTVYIFVAVPEPGINYPIA